MCCSSPSYLIAHQITLNNSSPGFLPFSLQYVFITLSQLTVFKKYPIRRENYKAYWRQLRNEGDCCYGKIDNIYWKMDFSANSICEQYYIVLYVLMQTWRKCTSTTAYYSTNDYTMATISSTFSLLRLSSISIGTLRGKFNKLYTQGFWHINVATFLANYKVQKCATFYHYIAPLITFKKGLAQI